MPTERIDFSELPDDVKVAVLTRIGPLVKAETVASGLNSAVAVRLTTEHGETYVKGLPVEHPRVWTQAREAVVGAYVRGISPRVRWHLRVGGWDLVAFDVLDGRHADYAPGSADLPLVAVTWERLSVLRAPDGVELKGAGHRLRDHAPAAALALFSGDALCHTDPNPGNVMVGQGRAWLVDWAWATRGAAWLDAAYWVVWLIAEGGHLPVGAEAWASRVPAFRDAPEDALTAFAAANESVWSAIAEQSPDAWTHRVHTAAKAWASHRVRGRG
ncbi:aminoglycoside phosphotransferase [Streptomyces phaeolivaceus]|uniref:Aminoglycoside phosphotransferase n=1 Tax=Streptomyces phaeolivaceus TaxID=2653200 RepID=A0A5P8K7G0_9ACTN|nr:aminoglycoside phosphotransferase [Streptomyces phaeolivaceus]QFQ98980.1 aminoglycoside phosphotransferase [Streptomyces phaeolivaceus]